MADFVANIKVKFQIENVTAAKPSGGSGGTGGGPGAGEISAALKDLRSAFSGLSSDIRALSQTIQQFQSAQIRATAGVPGAGPGAAGTGVSGVTTLADSLVPGVRELREAMKAEKGGASEVREKARKDAEDSKRAAEEAEEAAKKVSDASKKVAEADILRAKALKELDPRRVTRGQLNLAGIFAHVLQDVAHDPAIRRRAADLEASIIRLFDFPNATAEARAVAARLQKDIGNIISAAQKAIAEGVELPEAIVRRAKGAISERLSIAQRDEGLDLPKGGAGIQAQLTQALGLSVLTQGVDQIDTLLSRLGKALEEGAPEDEIGILKRRFEQLSSSLTTFVERSKTLLAPGAGGQEITERAPEFRRRIQSELQVSPDALRLNETQRRAFEELQTSMRNSSRNVFESTRLVFRALADGGRNIDQFEANLRNFVDFLRNPATRSGIQATRDELNKFDAVLDNLRKTAQQAGGGLKAPPGTVGAEESGIFARLNVLRAQQRLFAPGRRAGESERFEFQTTDASGNINKVRGELLRLGDTLDTVRVKARQTSDNMFDRTSVRTALQRVATWGAAAGIVFGAVDAFRRAASVVVDTESAIIGLAKVMNESGSNLDAFKKRARDAAVTIAQEFGQPLADVLETMVLFGQQGRDLSESIELTRASALAANVTTLDQPQAASALTAATNQFNIAKSRSIEVVDKFNSVANNAAVTETQLAEALNKAGIAARNSGVSLDEFNGIVAAISEQTRQTGSEIGTALRFIFSRLQTDEASKGLAAVGISIRDAAGNTKSFIDIITELSQKFETLNEAQKTQVAIAVSGTRRFNTFLALLNNFSRFQELAAESANSAGSAMKEQEKVAQTAAFRIQQLKNSFASLALSLGDALLGPIKVVIESLKSVVDSLAGISPAITAAVASLALGSAAFARFGDNLASIFGTGSVFAGLGRAISGSLTKGLSDPAIEKALGAQLIPLTQLAPGTVLAKSVGDFGGATKGASTFAEALKKSNLQLLNQRGEIVKNAQAFTKFGATIRGFRVAPIGAVGEAIGGVSLGIAGLNSGLGKMITFFGKVGNSALRLTGAGLIFDALEKRVTTTNQALLLTIGRFAALIGLVTAGVYLFGKLSEALTQSGAEAAKALEPEINKRQEALNDINKQIASIKLLTDAREKLARTETGGEFIQDVQQDPELLDQISRGQFRSPFLERQELLAREQEARQQVGLANPQLIQSIDTLGNVILTSADAFDRLADSAADAQSQLLAISRAKVIEKLASELKPESGFARAAGEFIRGIPGARTVGGFFGANVEDLGTTQADIFNREREKFLRLIRDPRTQTVRDLGISLDVLDTNLADKLLKAGDDFSAAAADIKLTIKSIQDELNRLPPDASESLFRRLVRPGTAARQFFTQRAQIAEQETGRPVTTADIVGQTFLQNRAAIRDAQAATFIGISPEETIDRFREARIAERVIDFQRETTEEIEDSLEAGQLVLFPNIIGFPKQAIVEVTQTGRKQLRGVTDDLRVETVDVGTVFGAAIQQGVDAVTIDPTRVVEEINRTFAEVGRVTAGAGRGILIQRDIDLGANFRFDLTAQQRVAFSDEQLFADIFEAEGKLQDFLERFNASTQEGLEDVRKSLSPGLVDQFRELAEEADRVKTIARIRVELEEVTKAFEKAAQDIRDSGIKDVISAEFSGFLGARRGIVQRDFEQPLLRSELSPEQRADRAAGADIIKLTNTLVRLERAQGELVAGMEITSRNIETFASDFRSAGGVGGIRDPKSLTALAEIAAKRVADGFTRAEAHQTIIAERSLTEQQRAADLLQQLVDRSKGFKDPLTLGAALSTGAGIFQKSSPVAQEDFIRRLNQLDPEVVRQFSTEQLKTIVSNIPNAAEQIPTIVQQLQQSLSRDVSRGLTGDIVNFARRQQATETSGPSIDEIRQRALLSLSRIQPVATEQQQVLATAMDAALRDSGLVKAVSQQTGERVVFSKEQLAPVVSAFTSSLREFDSPQLDKIADDIDRQFEEGNEELNKIISDRLKELAGVSPARRAAEVDTGVLKQSVDEAGKAGKSYAKILIDATRSNQELLGSLRDTITAFHIVNRSVTGLGHEIENATASIIDQIVVNRQLSQLTTPVFGALAGVEVPQVDLGRHRRDLSARELTALESPELSRGLGEANAAFQGLVAQLKRIREEERRLLRARAEFEAEGNIQGIQQVDQALQELGNVALFVEGHVNSARGVLRDFGDSFRNIEAVNKLRVDVENLFRSFEKQRALLFDRTSIDAALGRGPFAFTRPTFEQFEQGQRGDLTRFERELETLRFQQRTGQISFADAARGRRRVGFEENEAVIQLAQERENRIFEAQVGLAEQLRGQLFDFASRGGAGADAAKALLDRLTSELEKAGDISPVSSFQRRTVRDPRTGRQVDVPASQIREFRGVPSLSGALERVQQISQQVREEEGQKNADRITQPLLAVLDQVPRKLDQIVDVIKNTFNVDESQALAEGIVAFNTNIPKLVRALELLSSDAPSAELLKVIRDLIDSLKSGQIDPDVLDKALNAVSVGTEDGQAITASQALDKLASSGEKAALIIGELLSNSPVGEFQALKDILTEVVPAFASIVSAFKDGLSSFSSVFQLFSGATRPQGLATGGLVSGPGGPTDDSVPIMASPGEFVIKASAVKNIGLAKLSALNKSNGTIKPDFGLKSKALFGFAEGGLIEQRIAEIQKRRQELFDKADVLASTGDVLSEGERNEVKELDRELRALELERAKLADVRVARRERLDDLEARGFRFGGPGEELVVTPPPEALDSPELRESVIAEEERRIAEEKRRASGVGKKGRFSKFEKGKIFVKRTKDGRLSFSDQPRGGGVDLSTLEGVDARNEDALFAEIERRSEVDRKKEEFDRRLIETRTSKHRELQEEFLRLSAEEGEVAGSDTRTKEYLEAVALLQNELNVRANRALSGLPQEIKIANSLLGVAFRATAGNSDEPDSFLGLVGDVAKSNLEFLGLATVGTPGGLEQTDFGAEDFQDLLVELRNTERRIGPRLSSLKGTAAGPLSLYPPPGNTPIDAGFLVRRNPEFSSVGVTYNPIEGTYSPEVLGFAISTNQQREAFLQAVLAQNIDELLPEAIRAVEAGGKFSGFAQRNNNIIKSAGLAGNFLADHRDVIESLPGGEALFKVGQGLTAAANVYGSIGGGIAGGLGDVATGGIEDGGGAFLTLLSLGLNQLPGIVSDASVNADRLAEERAEIEGLLKTTTDPEEIKILNRRLQQNTTDLWTLGTNTTLALVPAAKPLATAGGKLAAGAKNLAKAGRGELRGLAVNRRVRNVPLDEIPGRLKTVREGYSDPALPLETRRSFVLEERALESRRARLNARVEKKRISLEKKDAIIAERIAIEEAKLAEDAAKAKIITEETIKPKTSAGRKINKDRERLDKAAVEVDRLELEASILDESGVALGARRVDLPDTDVTGLALAGEGRALENLAAAPAEKTGFFSRAGRFLFNTPLKAAGRAAGVGGVVGGAFGFTSPIAIAAQGAAVLEPLIARLIRRGQPAATGTGVRGFLGSTTRSLRAFAGGLPANLALGPGAGLVGGLAAAFGPDIVRFIIDRVRKGRLGPAASQRSLSETVRSGVATTGPGFNLGPFRPRAGHGALPQAAPIDIIRRGAGAFRSAPRPRAPGITQGPVFEPSLAGRTPTLIPDLRLGPRFDPSLAGRRPTLVGVQPAPRGLPPTFAPDVPFGPVFDPSLAGRRPTLPGLEAVGVGRRHRLRGPGGRFIRRPEFIGPRQPGLGSRLVERQRGIIDPLLRDRAKVERIVGRRLGAGRVDIGRVSESLISEVVKGTALGETLVGDLVATLGGPLRKNQIVSRRTGPVVPQVVSSLQPAREVAGSLGGVSVPSVPTAVNIGLADTLPGAQLLDVAATRQRLLDFAAGKLTQEEFFAGSRFASPAGSPGINALIRERFGSPFRGGTESVSPPTVNIRPPKAAGVAPSVADVTRNIRGPAASLSAEAIEGLFKLFFGFKDGGKISGPGGPTSDRIPILASNGEFVLNAAAVNRLGLPLVENMNRTGRIPKFHDGGLVKNQSGVTFLSTDDIKGKAATQVVADAYGSDIVSEITTITSRLEELRSARQVLDQSPTGRKANFELIDKEIESLERRLEQLRGGKSLPASAAGYDFDPKTGLFHRRASTAGYGFDPSKGIFFKIDAAKERQELQQLTDQLIAERESREFGRTPGDVIPPSRERTGIEVLAESAPEVVKPFVGRNELIQKDLDQLDGFAAGGFIAGRGGPKSDSIPIKVSNGEFVLNADAVNRIGVPALRLLNEGIDLNRLPGFQDGGLVGGGQGGGIPIAVDTEAISSAIKQAITEALQGSQVTLNSEDAAQVISNAITSAFDNITLPEVTVDTGGVTVPLDIPSGGIPIDVSALSNLDLGGALGADVKNRIEVLEGRTEGNLQDINDILSTIGAVDFSSIQSISEEVGSIGSRTAELESGLTTLTNEVTRQEDKVLQAVDFRISERLNNDTTELRVDAKIDRVYAQIKAELDRVGGLISQAISQASKAMTLAQARR